MSDVTPSGDLNLGIKNLFKILNKISTDTSHINVKILEIDAKLNAMDERFDKMENRISTLEDHEVEDLENRSRCNNICIRGLPESVEDGKPIDSKKKNTYLCSPSPRPNQCPRPIIMRLLKFQTRELLLRKAREKQLILWDNHKISFFQDLSKEVQLKRKAFAEAKRRFRDHMAKYTMAYLAILCVHYEG
uniref:L1 transposable element RRM domain-containing protein n=1 Tax=Latimeria chalumnae TaxID=7897 RepID=H3AVM0_LATCH